MAREKEHLIGAYFEKDSLSDIDSLSFDLFKAGLIPKNNRSELIRFCVEFMQGYMEQLCEHIEGIKTVMDFLVLEKVLQQDSLDAFAAVSTKLLTDNVIASIGGQLTEWVT